MIYRTAPYSVTLDDPYHDFKVTPLFDAEYLRNGTRHRHSFNGIIIGTYTRSTQQCHLEWPWVILSDLAKYSMTRSVGRSLCYRASCSILNGVLWMTFLSGCFATLTRRWLVRRKRNWAIFLNKLLGVSIISKFEIKFVHFPSTWMPVGLQMLDTGTHCESQNVNRFGRAERSWRW